MPKVVSSLSSRKRKWAAAGAALVIEGGLVIALVTGLAQKFVRSIVPENLTVTTITPEPSPTPPPKPVTRPEGAAAPAGAKAKAEAQPQPKVALASPTPAATVSGNAVSGQGSGAGGNGSGSGAGGSGNGSGSGIASGPERVAGGVSDRDYPRNSGRSGGTVGVAFRVRSDGAVDQCRVIASSGSSQLDGLTCTLVEQRFRYRPATNGVGQPVDSSLRTSFTYGPR